MSQGKLVRISADTMKKLADVRQGFENPDECINRVLGSTSCQKKTEEAESNAE